jgi:GTP-binding protein LepA
MEKNNIRNFCIISHIDAGKSTLADRFLEVTETVSKKDMQDQFLDDMELERERGITIKLRPVRMIYRPKKNQEKYILNLIDTPGHVDFSYEVSRSLEAVEGAVLLVDATKGVQAQTLANLDLAKKKGDNFKIIPVINKIDLDGANIPEVEEEMEQTLGVEKKDIIKISGKNGVNIEAVLDAVVERVPCPERETEKQLRALVFDSEFNAFKGIIAHVRIVEGEISEREKISLFASKGDGEAKEVGFFSPKHTPQKKLLAGDIGYIATGIKEVGVVKSGDTIYAKQEEIEPLPGYKEPHPMVFSSFYPRYPEDYTNFYNALLEIKLTDPAFVFHPEFKQVFGRGFRCGFLGSLHSEIISQRLSRDYDIDLIISAPSVAFLAVMKTGKEEEIKSPSDWPDQSGVAEMKEPWAKIEIITPEDTLGKVNEVLATLRGSYVDTQYISSNRVLIIYTAPLRKMIINFYDNLKSSTQGYASAGYKLQGFYPGDLVKMEILIAHQVDEAFSVVVARDEAFKEGKSTVAKLKEVIPPQQFAVPIQARVGGKIIARETIKARRKDVTASLYGGDITRKRKLLEKQKKGKKRLEREGKVNIPEEAYFKVFNK